MQERKREGFIFVKYLVYLATTFNINTFYTYEKNISVLVFLDSEFLLTVSERSRCVGSGCMQSEYFSPVDGCTNMILNDTLILY